MLNMGSAQNEALQPISVILAPATPREISCPPLFLRYRGLFFDSFTTSNLSVVTTRYYYGIAI
jgi:hypothetical protein